MRITNDNTNFKAYFTNNESFRTLLHRGMPSKTLLELSDKFAKLPNHEITIATEEVFQRGLNAQYSLYNNVTGKRFVTITRSYEPLEELLHQFLSYGYLKEFFEESAPLARIIKNLTSKESAK